MIGQENLLKKLTNYTQSNFPHSVLLLGERGSYQREICEYISTNLGLDLFDLTKVENFKEFIETIYGNPTPTLYTIDLLEFDDSKDLKQNSLLKLFEEPNSYSYIIIYGENDSHILDTIKNRSYIIETDQYSKEQLLPLITGDKELTLSLCNTPGQVEMANHNDLISLNKLCNNILENMNKATFPNTLSIANKINFKDEYSKFDLLLFIRCLGNCILNNINNNVILYSNMYKYLRELGNKIWLVRDKKQQFENFLIKLWIVSREDNSLQEIHKEV